MKKILSLTLILLFPTLCWSQAWEAYFSNPTGGGDDLEQEVRDILDAAQSSIDITIYSFSSNQILTGLLDAMGRGVAVNFVYDQGASSTWIDCLITNGATGKQEDDQVSYASHNKFIVVDRADAGSSVRDTVWTGSFNWVPAAANSQFNNAIRVNQNSRVTDAFYSEFTEMFGDGTSGNFHQVKTNYTGPFSFDVSGGSSNDDMIYFSPQDDIEQQIVNAINTADEQIQFNIFTFTTEAIMSALMDAVDRGVEVTGIFDHNQSEAVSSQMDIYNALVAYTNLSNQFDSEYTLEGGTGILAYIHSKYLVIDPGSTSDSIVITGSANWTAAANTHNDENVLILRDGDVASSYLTVFDTEWGSQRSFQSGGQDIPEPSSLLMLILGGTTSLFAWGWRRKS